MTDLLPTLRCLAFTVVFAAGLTAESGERPNVLFICIDDMRAEAGFLGSAHVETPHLDRLAARGTVFTNAFAQYPLCAPSRSSMFTGLRPDRLGIFDIYQHFRESLPNVVTLPQHFRDAGYRTQGVGKVFHSRLNDPLSWSDGYYSPDRDDFIYSDPETMADIRRRREEVRHRKDLTQRQKSQHAYGPATERRAAAESDYFDGHVADSALVAMGEMAAREEPFFLAVGFRKPHLPFVAPDSYWRMYDDSLLPLAEPMAEGHGVPDFAAMDAGEFISYRGHPASPYAEPYQRHLKQAYYACLSFVDAQIGRLLAEVDRLGLTGRTLVVVWSDHGYHLGERGHWGKWSPDDYDARAPFLLAGPGVPEGHKFDHVVEFIDVFPTVVELGGGATPTGIDGVSLVPLLSGDSAAHSGVAFTQVVRYLDQGALIGRSVRDNRFRYTKWVRADGQQTVVARELYDHETDTREYLNVIGDPTYRAEVDRLDALIEASLAKTDM